LVDRFAAFWKWIMDDWCDQEDWVPDGSRVYRCTKCGKRLYPRERQEQSEFVGWQLPPHKTKGHRIRTIKARQHKIRRAQKGRGLEGRRRTR
jgi:hypothetical protein